MHHMQIMHNMQNMQNIQDEDTTDLHAGMPYEFCPVHLAA
jgi:hypothetical protein